MNKKITAGALTAIILAIVAGVYVSGKKESLPSDISDTTLKAPQELKVMSTEVIAATEDAVDPGVYVTLSNGDAKLIAASSDLDTLENYFEVITYREAFVSPDKTFVAVEGSQFEDAIVQVYDPATDVLHEIMYGVVSGWTTNGLLRIESCDLSGESCTDKISVSSLTPWIVEDVEEGQTAR